MVEPVEPDWRVYERVKSRIGGFSANPFYAALGARMGEDGLPLPPPEATQAPHISPPHLAPGPTAPNPPATPPQQGPAAAPLPQQAEPQPAAAGLWDFTASEAAPPETVTEGSAETEAPATAAAPEPQVTSTPALDVPAVESPPLASPAPVREPTLVDPKTAQPIAHVPASERTIPFAEHQRSAPLIVPAAQLARDTARSHRSIRQWRALAMMMTLLALSLAGLVAGLRNFPDRLPPSVRAQFPALAAMPTGSLRRLRVPAPPESQFDE
jgi:hypothetical protein